MADEKFELVSSYQPTGDQPQAIETLVKGVERGDRCQTLLGVTGSGKTFTMANVIAKCNRPTLVLAHNKTLAAQLCTEFRSFFPNNAVEYFVSYYDYYQPEAYIPSTDTYIEKDSAINDEIDRLRHSATAALSAWACTSSSLASRASVMALRASLSNWPTAGFSSLGTSFMPVWARVNSPFLPRMATRASSTPRLSDAWAMRARASRWMRTISSFIKFDGQELTRPPRQRQALRAAGRSLKRKWRTPERGKEQ